MQRWKIRLFWTLLALTPVLCIAGLGWCLHAERVQQQRDHALRAAIKKDDLPGVLAALAAGADANTRETPPDKRTLWMRLRDMFRRNAPKSEPMRSALTMVMQRDLDADVLHPSDVRLAILKALHDKGATAEGDAPQFRAELQNSLRQAQAFSVLPVASVPPSNYSGARDALHWFLWNHGMSAAAYLGLAEYFREVDDYDAALHAYRVAQLWRPNDAAIQAGIAQTQEAQRVAAAITRLRTDKLHAVSVRPCFDETGRHLWAALCAPEETYTYAFNQMLLALYEEREGAFRRLSEFKDFDSQSFHLFVRRVTGRPAPEIVVQEEYTDRDAAPTRLSVFEVRADRLRPLLRLDSETTAYLEDLRHDGHYVARNQYGYPPYSDREYKPIRSDIYAYNGDRFVFADAAYPEESRKYVAEAEAYLVDHPYESEVYCYLAYYYSITGDPRNAERCWRKAERTCRTIIANSDDSNNVDYNRRLLKRILSRDTTPGP